MPFAISKKVTPLDKLSRLSVHLGGMLGAYDIEMVNAPALGNFHYASGTVMDTGLIRTEAHARNALKNSLIGQQTYEYDSPLPQDISPMLYTLRSPNCVFRFVDLHALYDFMSNNMKEDFNNGHDHDPTKKLFLERQRLYLHQCNRIKTHIESLLFTNPYTLLLPDVENSEEVIALKKALLEEVFGIKFGVMMETKAALKNTREIALHCDRLAYGTNDLAEHLTGIPRPTWMEAQDENGKNPYKELTPVVLEAMAQSIEEAKAVNPDIIISVCGYQVAGHDIASIEACLRMGVDQIVVPALDNNIIRAGAAIARFDARRELALSPELGQNFDEPGLC